MTLGGVCFIIGAALCGGAMHVVMVRFLDTLHHRTLF